MHLKLLSLLLSGFSLVSCENDEIIVELDNGAIRGTTMESVDGVEYFAFLGIPYTEPPLGELRFKPPVPKKPWSKNGILDATKDGAVCIQVDLISKSVIGNENCLFVNVYTKQYLSEKKYPVMVWIHGGAFRFGHGSSWMYGPSRFIAEDVVLVSFNYRLNSLGFLATNDDASPGNYGLLDQLEALKWVKANIDAFGGDANQVTLFGQSAGSVSTYYQMLSPLSEGLFHRVIALSGSPLCPWGFEDEPQYWAKKVGKALKCPTDHHELVDCLRKISAAEIIKAAEPFTKDIMIPFPPVVDGKFITIDPRTSFEGGIMSKIPLMTGIVRDEGVGIYGLIHFKLQKYSEQLLNQNIRSAINDDRDIPSVIELIKQRYMQNCDVSSKLETAVAISKFLGDAVFDVCGYEAVKHSLNAGVKTHVYNFDFAANYSILNLLGIKEYLGVAHGDELWYLFDGKLFDNFMRNDRVKQMAVKFVKLLANFAKFGDATHDFDIKWPPSAPGNIKVYHIDEESHVEEYDFKNDPRTEFWIKTVPRSIKNSAEQKQKTEL
uniref:Carboxylic ester hydrolase n=1 Tax=Strigamia maritima TaxID=126957 RepID=T1JEJ8_STRMM